MTSEVSSNCKSNYFPFCGASLYPKSPLVPVCDRVRTGPKIWPETMFLSPALTEDEQSPDTCPWILPAAAKTDSSARRVGAQLILA